MKLTMVKGGIAAVYFLSIQSKRFVPLMNEIVASMMILLTTDFRSLLPKRSILNGFWHRIKVFTTFLKKVESAMNSLKDLAKIKTQR